jgi:hypothetical protein
MEFKEFKTLLQKHVAMMLVDTAYLFVVDCDKMELWATYLESFPAESNQVYRKRREFDCSPCRHFIKSFGNVVKIKDNKVTTIWDFEVDSPVYRPVVQALGRYIRGKAVTDVFVTPYNAFGTDLDHDLADGKVITWDHLYIKLPKAFPCTRKDDVGKKMSNFRDIRNVFKRSLEEISEDAVVTVLELIAQKSLYKGEEWQGVLTNFLKFHKAYAKLSDASMKENFAWENSITAGPVVGKIRNHSIGVLLTNITNGVELEDAVKDYEATVAPTNYKRPKAIFTTKMLEAAKAKLEELGLIDSLGRRFAVLDDITVNNIIFANRDVARKIKGSVFDDMAKEVAVDPRSFERMEEIPFDAYLRDVLPLADQIEILVENRHRPNFVSLIAPKVPGSKPLFKWANGFSWAYMGNITDSMKERVKAMGGDVEGVLRFSIQWNDNPDKYNSNDFDAHCKTPSFEICYHAKRDPKTGGQLDVDITRPENGETAVENITWSNLSKMTPGKYEFFVHCFNNRGSSEGFTAEIEFEGQIFPFAYNKGLRQDERVVVAIVTLSKEGRFTIDPKLPTSTSSMNVWGVPTNQFHPVNVIMHSPNYWDGQNGIGHRHVFFMLPGCENKESPNGFFNEYLHQDLLEHKRVFEALGSKMRVEDAPDQLSGLGFSTTKHDVVVCRVQGRVSRTLRIKF